MGQDAHQCLAEPVGGPEELPLQLGEGCERSQGILDQDTPLVTRGESDEGLSAHELRTRTGPLGTFFAWLAPAGSGRALGAHQIPCKALRVSMQNRLAV